MESAVDYIKLVSKMVDVPVELIISKGRKREYCEARQVCSFILKEATKLSSQNIADKLHYGSHASPLRDVKQVAMFLETDKKFKAKYMPVINAARDIARQLKNSADAKNELKLPFPGTICWFWNLWSRFPVIGTYDKSFINSENQQRFICREYPSFTFSSCTYAGQEILPEKFKTPLFNQMLEDFISPKSESIPA